MKETEIIRLLAAFIIEFATAKVDARTLPPEVLYRRIGKIKECMPEMIDYLRREAPRGVYDGIKGFTRNSQTRLTSGSATSSSCKPTSWL
jgi:hypothetical protein